MPVFISWIAFLRYWSLTETEIFIWPLVMILMFNFIVLSLCLCWYYDIYLCLPVNMNNFRRFAGRLFIFQCNALRILTVIFGIWQSHIVLQKKKTHGFSLLSSSEISDYFGTQKEPKISRWNWNIIEFK